MGLDEEERPGWRLHRYHIHNGWRNSCYGVLLKVIDEIRCLPVAHRDSKAAPESNR